MVLTLNRLWSTWIVRHTRLHGRDIYRLGLDIIHALALIGTASRQYINLLHWLPLLLAVTRAIHACRRTAVDECRGIDGREAGDSGENGKRCSRIGTTI